MLADAAQAGVDALALPHAVLRALWAQGRDIGDTRRSIAAEVVGSPAWAVAGERSWGQDRLDLVAERIVGG